jgi:hypothetical protein
VLAIIEFGYIYVLLSSSRTNDKPISGKKRVMKMNGHKGLLAGLPVRAPAEGWISAV